MSIYQEIILDHYNNPRNKGVLKTPTNSVSVSNPLCGDKITLQVMIENNTITDIAFSGVGCAISQAAASMVTEYVRGKSITELQTFPKEQVTEMLGVELSPNRLKCAWLSWEALVKILE